MAKRKVKRSKGLHFIAENDPERYRDRTVMPEKGKGRKNRPRKKGWDKDSGPSGFYNLTCGPRWVIMKHEVRAL